MKSERNPNGTFAEGNPGGPGRPTRATERRWGFRAALQRKSDNLSGLGLEQRSQAQLPGVGRRAGKCPQRAAAHRCSKCANAPEM